MVYGCEIKNAENETNELGDTQMERFEVLESETGNYKVFDNVANRFVRYSYSKPPLYSTLENPGTVWQNYYSARGFSQKLAARQ